MTLLEFDPISVERLIQPHSDHLRQFPDEKLVFRNESTCSVNVFVFEGRLHGTFPLYEDDRYDDTVCLVVHPAKTGHLI